METGLDAEDPLRPMAEMLTEFVMEAGVPRSEPNRTSGLP
jgi:hypothetical protein